MRLLFGGLFLLSLTSVALGQHESVTIGDSGNEFLRVCQHTPEQSDSDSSVTSKQALADVECLAWFDGFVEGVNVSSIALRKKQICWPKDSTRRQTLQVVIKYMKEHPESLHDPTGVIGFFAFKQAFPCADNK